jgi:outer membrane protein insertion porin family
MRIAIIALAIAGFVSTARAEVIREIAVEENKKTDDETVALIARLEVDDDWNVDMIQTVTLRLEASGLFKDVRVFSEPHKSGSGVKVTIIVHDKHSWVIAPAFYTQPTNIGGGIGFGENNLFGKNQKLLIYGQIATQDTFFIGAWVIPNLGGTRWYAQIDTFLKSQRNIEYAAPTEYINSDPGAGANKQIRESRLNYLNAGLRLGIELFRGFKIDARLRGATVNYADVKLVEGASLEEAGGEDPNNPGQPKAPGEEGADVSTEFTMSLDRKANYHGVQTGYRYGASFETSSRGLGSDFRYFYTGLSIFRGERILNRHNFVFRSTANYGFHMPFQQEFLTGGTSMRGWLNNQFRGDFRAIANIEYSVPFISVGGFSTRLLAFWDSAYTTFLRTDNPQRNYLPNAQRDQANNSSKFNEYLAPFKNSVGIGTRFYLKQIVLPLLGVDVGYGLEARDVQVYLAIGLTD